MTTIVTGGGGFLGSTIARRLLAEGHHVRIVARGSYPALSAAGAEAVQVDVGDPDAVQRAFEGAALVFHVAAKTGVWGRREDFVHANVTGTKNVLAACRALGIPRLVHTSSPSVVFDGHDHDDAGPDLPYPERYEAFYPETKAEAERLVLAANDASLATVALRPHLIYGPGDPWLLPRIIARHRQGRLRIVGDGQNRVSLTYVENAAAAHLQVAAALTPGAPCAGRAWFVNDAEPVRLWEWLNAMFLEIGLPRLERHISLGTARTLGSVLETTWRLFGLSGDPPMTRFVAAQMASSHSYALGPARAAFGYTPPFSGEDGFRITAAAWKEKA
jgi:nucleoside-diphosphate-sugar epimerase